MVSPFLLLLSTARVVISLLDFVEKGAIVRIILPLPLSFSRINNAIKTLFDASYFIRLHLMQFNVFLFSAQFLISYLRIREIMPKLFWR